MRRAAVLLIATSFVLGAGATSAEARLTAAERAVETQIDDLRADNGCGPLRTHAGLARAADRQSRLLVADGRLDHDAGTPFAERLQRAAPAASQLGEVLAWGAGTSAEPAAIVRMWMNSPAHRSVLLDCSFTQIGVGSASGRFGESEDATVYTADLAA